MSSLSSRWVVLFPIGASALFAAQACFDEPTGPQSPGVTPGGSTGASTVITGTGGGGGTGAGGTGAGAGGNVNPDTPDNCACILNLSDGGPCVDCKNEADGATCANQLATCEEDRDCTTILGCILGCPPIGDSAECINTCYADQPAAALDLVDAYVDCACDTACTAECDGASTTCEPGEGGAGGAGTGGAGGDGTAGAGGIRT